MPSKNNSLDQWLAYEARAREHLNAGPGPGVAPADQIAGKTGPKQMQAMLSGQIPCAAIA